MTRPALDPENMHTLQPISGTDLPDTTSKGKRPQSSYTLLENVENIVPEKQCLTDMENRLDKVSTNIGGRNLP